MSKLSPAEHERAKQLAHEIFRKKTLGGLRSRRLGALVKPPPAAPDHQEPDGDLLDGGGLESMMSMYDDHDGKK